MAIKKNSLVTEAARYAESAEKHLDWSPIGYDHRKADSVAFYHNRGEIEAIHVSGMDSQATVFIDARTEEIFILWHGKDRSILANWKKCIVYRRDLRGTWRESHRI